MELTKRFSSMVFNDNRLRERLPKDIYKKLRESISDGKEISIDVANVVAATMKSWALERGATHFSHWFMPMNGITAEKHDSFMMPDGTSNVILEFSGKALIKGESDASSFPSGGLRATFEARGYTAWDPTSYAFIKDNTLYIPTAFCSYSGEALDKKTPLLRSMEAINKQAKRVLKLFGNNNVKKVSPTVGAEQEYFLITKEMYTNRPDLIYTGRTLFGAMPPKTQELEDHYFGVLKPKVAMFMKRLDDELCKLGVLAKTKHNETAPAQHELATYFSTANVATDNNQLTMELMKTIADELGLACLLHEKPFKGINGTGKHNNWSLSTDDGTNLLEPGATPHDNAQFLLFLVAIIKAVHKNQDLLRISVATASNDHRLGAFEAPPAIISIFLGDELTEVLESIENDSEYKNKEKTKLKVGVHCLPHISKDTTDRNRTSPFAFSGNKFEFRMVGSSHSIAEPNTILNTIVADELCTFADILEKSENFDEDLNNVIKQAIKDHKNIVFNGNNYDQIWIDEACERGLLNLRTTPDALPYFTKEKNINLFNKHKVFSESEIYSRYEIYSENYCKIVKIEALTLINIVNKNILHYAIRYENFLSETIINKSKLNINTTVETNILNNICNLKLNIYENLELLKANIENSENEYSIEDKTFYIRDNILDVMDEIRLYIDPLEDIIPKDYWVLPTCSDILFSVL